MISVLVSLKERVVLITTEKLCHIRSLETFLKLYAKTGNRFWKNIKITINVD